MSAAQSAPATVLIVDDDAVACKALQMALRGPDYHLVFAHTGDEALSQLEADLSPDAILLDIVMPGMDGFEVCRRIKRDQRWQRVPVVLVTALGGKEHLLRGLEAGADEFLSKPVIVAELRARLRTVLRVKRQYDELEALMVLRDHLTHMIIHDLKNPLGVVAAALHLAEATLPPQQTLAARALKKASAGAQTMRDLILQLLDISRLEAGEMPLSLREGDLTQTVRAALDFVSILAGERHLCWQAPEPVLAVYDDDLIRRVVGNLLGNAFKFTPADGEIRVAVTREGLTARVTVTDTGPGIPPEYQEKIFQKFSQLECKRELGTGLGLTFCKLALEAQGGQIGVLSPNPRLPAGTVQSAIPNPQSEMVPPQPHAPGATFWFTLPAPVGSRP